MNRQDQESPLVRCALSLSQSLSKSLESYSLLLSLEKEQQTLIENGDLEGAANRIAQKQDLLVAIQNADQNLQEEYKAWQEVRSSAPENLRDRLQEQVDSLQQVISEILAIQKSNEANLHQHAEEIGQKLKDIQQRRTAHRGYQQRAAQDAYGKSRYYDNNT